MRGYKGFLIGTGVLAGVLAGPAPIARAQDADDVAGSATEEIVVTARKRAETVQDAPLSIKAFTAAQIEERGIEGMADLTRFAPGLTFVEGTSRSASTFSIRGMNQVAATGDNRRDLVTVFIDGTPYVGSPAGIGVEDLERVEVIKGPQSALFGRATFGGAISLITTTPGDEIKARASFTAADYGDYRLSGSVEGPLVPGILAGRLVGEASTFDGFWENSLGGRLGASNRSYGAATLSFTPVESFSIKARYGVRHDEDGPAATALIARFTDHNCGPFPGFQTRALTGLPAGFTVERARRAYCGELQTPASVGINTTTPAASIPRLKFSEHGLILDHTLASVTANLEFLGGHSLTGIVSDQSQDIRQLSDFERAPEDRYQVFISNTQTLDSYEARLASPGDQRFTWMIGASRLEATYDSIGAFINGSLFGPTAGGPASLTPSRNGSETDSIYASIGFDVTDKLNVSAEARRQDDTIISGIGTPTRFEVNTKATLPRYLVRYELTDQTNLYANYAEGNQPTQGYSTFFALTPAQRDVARRNGVSETAPEAQVTNTEIGIKHRAADGRFFVNVALYYLEWIGRQGVRTIQVDLNNDGVITVTPAPAGEVFNAVPFSAGDSNTRGIEIDGAINLTERIAVGGNVAYADTEITKALNETLPLRFFGRTDAKGAQFPNAPEWTGAAFASYDAPLMGDLSWFARADLTYIGKRYDSIVNLACVPETWRTNIRGGVRNDAWELTGFVTNLFDDDTLESASYNSDSAADPFLFQLAASEAVLPRKRQVGVTLTVRY